jgi:hypothetical protein
MTVILMLLMFVLFIGIDYVRTYVTHALPKGTNITTPGYEMLGALAQDGGEKIEPPTVEDLCRDIEELKQKVQRLEEQREVNYPTVFRY